VLRRPTGPFGWLEDRLLREGWLERLGPPGTAVLVLLALAADKHGVSFYSRDVMARRLAMSRAAVDQALARLRELGLVEHRPWRPGHQDGVWQLLPFTPVKAVERGGGLLPVRDILAQLGLVAH
jgi:DNA-binding transcriptional ArsR family regulator